LKPSGGGDSFAEVNTTPPGALRCAGILVKMMNPMNYIGTDGTTTAPYWRLCIDSKDAMVANNMILTVKLRNEGFDVDSTLAWDVDHGGDYELDGLFAWIDLISG
jgi:hypothetical protein